MRLKFIDPFGMTVDFIFLATCAANDNNDGR